MNEAELLFTEVLNCDRLSLYLNRDSVLDKNKLLNVSSALKRRIKGEPVQYIIGKAEFMGLEFKVNSKCLIPRPETEILVEAAIRLAQGKGKEMRILDLGTGSGCIAVSLAKFLPGAKITAADISPEALKIARYNAAAHNVEINFFKSDLFSSHELRAMSYGLIISNPPYVSSLELSRLQPEVKHEPPIALDGGKDGLDFYRRIIKDAPSRLKEGGFLLFEIGFGQKDKIEKILQNSGYFEIIESIKDYNNIDRVVVAKKASQR